MGYTKDALKGLSWITLLRASTRIITFIRLAILGRLLTPVQFGYFGIATLVLVFLEILTETGINVFFVQQKEDIHKYLNSAWYISIFRGVFLGLVILLLAPFIASFFNSDEAVSVIMLIAAVPFIRGFLNPAIVLYQKDLLFHKEFNLRFILFMVDVIISVITGLLTRNAVCFAYGLIASAFIEVTLSFWLFSIRPKFKLEIDKIKYIINKGKWITLTGIFSYFADNSDNILVGKLLGSAPLGIYQVAYKFSTLPISEVTQVVNQVVFPVYTKFSDDKHRLWTAFKKVTLLTLLSGTFFGTLIYFFAEQIIVILMGQQWIEAVPIVRILAIYGILRTIFGSFSPLFLSVGRQDLVAKMLFVRVVVLIFTIVPLINIYGMSGAAYAMLISVLFEIPVILFFTHLIFKNKN